MRLFVKTQDKTSVMEINCARYNLVTKTENTRGEYGNLIREVYEYHRVVCCGKVLGTYKSKERCLEIVEELWELFKKGEDATYEMPEA